MPLARHRLTNTVYLRRGRFAADYRPIERECPWCRVISGRFVPSGPIRSICEEVRVPPVPLQPTQANPSPRTRMSSRRGTHRSRSSASSARVLAWPKRRREIRWIALLRGNRPIRRTADTWVPASRNCQRGTLGANRNRFTGLLQGIQTQGHGLRQPCPSQSTATRNARPPGACRWPLRPALLSAGQDSL